MTRINIPKEYVLELPAYYDEPKLRHHLTACLSVTTLKRIYEEGSALFCSFFRSDEHKEIALDLLRFVIDTDSKASESIVRRRFFAALYEAGFFG